MCWAEGIGAGARPSAGGPRPRPGGMRRGGGGSGGDCGFKSAPGARSPEPPGVPRCCAPRRAEPGAGRTAQPAAGWASAGRAWARGALSARARGAGLRSRGSSGSTPRGRARGPRGGRGRRGRGAGRRGHVTGLFTNSAGPAEGAGAARGPGRGSGTRPRSRAGLGCAIGDLETRSPLLPQHSSRGLGLLGPGCVLRTGSVPADAGCPLGTLGLERGPRSPRPWATCCPRNSRERSAATGPRWPQPSSCPAASRRLPGVLAKEVGARSLLPDGL